MKTEIIICHVLSYGVLSESYLFKTCIYFGKTWTVGIQVIYGNNQFIFFVYFLVLTAVTGALCVSISADDFILRC